MEVAGKVLGAVSTALTQLGRINDTMSVSELVNSLGVVLTSVNDLRTIANSTGLTLDVVNKTIIEVYLCVNSTLGTKKEAQVINCFVPPTTAPTTAAKDPCVALEKDLNALLLVVLFLISVVFVFVMSFVEKRKYKTKCCYGRPGAVVPLNMLDSYENRFGNALVFGATTSYCLSVLFDNVDSILGSNWAPVVAAAPGYVGVLFKIMATVVIAMSAYPLFVCMRTNHKTVGSAFGIFYALVWIGLLLYKVIVYSRACFLEQHLGSGSARTIAMEVLTSLPQFVCLVLLLVKFTIMLIKAIRKRIGRWDAAAEDIHDDFRENYMYHHVLNLLKRVESSGKVAEVETLKSKLRKKIYQWKPEFRYSTRVLSAFMVSGITVYILTVLWIWLVWFYLDFLLDGLVKSKDFETFVKAYLNLDVSFVGKIRSHIKIWIGCFYAAIILTAIKTTLLFLNMLAWYRGHIMRLRRGDRSWLPTSIRTLNASPSSLLAASMKYAGFQVAYAAWGFILFGIVMWLALGIVMSFILYPLFTGQSSIMFPLLQSAWPALVISLVVAFSQRLAAINAFHIMSFFMFYFNIFLGLFSCLLRLIKGMVVGLLFIERVQKSVLPRAFEKMDPGYFAYIGYILIEHSHANPVLCVFFSLLNDHVKQSHKAVIASQLRFMENVSNDEIELKEANNGDAKGKYLQKESENRWRIVRNRWNLAYSLINNPSLQKYRKGREEKNEEVEEEEPSDCDKESLKEKMSLTPIIAV
eukprot:gene10881-19704_t